MMCDNLYRFRNAITRKVVNDAVLSIIYSGSLGLGRWNSIIDLCNAAKLLETQGFKIMITVFATLIPSEAVNKLREKDNLQILPGPSHEELPSYLKGADILFLPETFDPVKADEIRLSISTKAHFYMMSEKPILVYASPITGIVEYAKDEEWACVVEEQSLNKLSQAILKLITNNEYRKSLTNKGLEVVEKNHSQDIVRERFLSLLSKC
jgi:glycosyltransferase involved in cell wall biosynthesis